MASRYVRIRSACKRGRGKRRCGPCDKGRNQPRKDDMNPIWTHLINDATRQIKRVCTHCRRAGKYAKKRAGQFYKCRYCGHRFQEKKK